MVEMIAEKQELDKKRLLRKPQNSIGGTMRPGLYGRGFFMYTSKHADLGQQKAPEVLILGVIVCKSVCNFSKSLICKVCSGERGIRTPGTFRYAGFQDRCNRPLYHLSCTFRAKVAHLTLLGKFTCAALCCFPKSDAKIGSFCERAKCWGFFLVLRYKSQNPHACDSRGWDSHGPHCRTSHKVFCAGRCWNTNPGRAVNSLSAQTQNLTACS